MENKAYQTNQVSGSVPKSKNRKPIIIGLVLAIIAIIILVIVLVALLNGGDQAVSVQGAGEDTPILQLYMELDNETTIEELEQQVKKTTPSATIKYEDDYSGYVTIDGYRDQLAFSIEPRTDEIIIDELLEEDDEASSQPVIYNSDDVVYDISYELLEGDDGYYIAYSDYGEIYQLYDLQELREFSTKKEAVDAYLQIK